MSDTPLVSTETSPNHYDIARIKTIIKQYDPRHLKQGETGYLSLSERDINTLLITTLSLLKKGRAKTYLHKGKLVIDLSVQLPENQYGQFANISLSLKTSPLKLLTIEQITFGSLKIPGQFIQPIWNISNQYLHQFEEYKRLSNAVQTVQITEKQLNLTYRADWEAVKQLKQRGQTLLFSDSEQDKIRVYQHHLFQISKNQYTRRISLSEVLQPMFQLALERSKTANPVEENRTLLLVLAMHSAGKDINTLLGNKMRGQGRLPLAHIQATLHNRVDLMQHFSISAFLASTAGDTLAHATGLFKEISDSQGGSGFSFADLAADQAGVELGSMAVASEASAHSLQLHLSKSSKEKDFMPNIDHLPEGLSEAIFKQRYGSTEDAMYEKMQHELDKRLKTCALYKK